jgi:uncharacterized protein YbjT (DUF2867 family)
MLQARGADVRAASRSPHDGMIIFDWQDSMTHRDALNGVDSIYLVPPELLENAVPVVEPFLAMAAGAGVKRVVLLSSMGAGFPGEPVASGRLALEALLQGCGLEWTILRPSGFMQNFSEGFLLPAVRNGVLPNPAGDGRVGMVDVSDIALVAAAVLTCGDTGHSGHIYDVTGPNAISFVDAAATIARVAGRPVAARPMSAPQFLAMLESAGVPHDYAAMLVRDQEAIREGAAAVVADTVACIGGHDPIDFQQYAADAALAWSP